jgi:hypothetical protein
MRLRLAAIIGLIATAIPASSQADFVYGQEVTNACKVKPDEVGYLVYNASCREYIVGVLDGLDLLFAERVIEDPSYRLPYCLPKRVSRGDVMRAVSDFVGEVPTASNLPASLLILAAMRATYPCP